MRKLVKVLIFIAFTLGLGYMIYSKRKQLKNKLKEIEESLGKSKFTQEVKLKFEETISSLKKLIEKEGSIDKTLDEDILNIVEEKIKRLEELIKQEERR